MSIFLRFIGCLFLLSIGTIEYGYSRTLSPLDSTDGPEQRLDTTLSKDHLNSRTLIDLPLRTLSGLALTLPTAYTDGDGLHLYNTGLAESNFIVDGMQIRYAASFPYRAIRQIHDYGLITPIGVGNALNLIGVGTECNLDTGYISIESAADFRLYKMSSDYPLGSKSGQTHFYPNGNDLIALDAGGPFKIGKRTGSIFIAVNLAKQNEQTPSSINNYQVKSSVLTDLQNDPLRSSGYGSGSFENTEYITASDIEQSRYSSNAGIKGVNSYFRVEFPFTDNLRLALGSYVNVSKGRQFIYANSMFNAENNPEVVTRNFDNYAQLSHVLVEKESMKLSYVAQVTYSNYYKKLQSSAHKDAVFRYGYLGKFNTYTSNSYELGVDSMTGLVGYLQNGFVDSLYTFEPGGYNPVAENVTTDYYNLYTDPTGHYENRVQVLGGGGLVNGYVPGSLSNNVYGVWNSPGAIYDLYAIKNEEVIRGKGLFELVKGKHTFHLGFEVTRQMERSYAMKPVELWRQMRLLTNSHILQLDMLNPELQLVYDPFSDTYVFPSGGNIDYPRLYDGNSQTNFDKNLRADLGMAENSTEWIDLNSLPLETFSLDMFSADELLNNGNSLVSYYGYDYVGNKMGHSDKALDYFTAVDDEGNYTRNVGAYQPISGAAYLDYGFEEKNLKFSIELRTDYFNSNQPVLKDKYSFYEIRTVSEVSGTLNSSGSHPSGVEADFAVYVNDNTNPTQILGYRDGDQWYNDAGQEISNASSLTTSSGVIPYLVNPLASLADAFENSSALVYIIPQFSIEYKIGSGTRVFASHSAATQNPRIINVFRPEQYLNIQNANVIVNNTAIRPLRTAKIKAGFGQKVARLTVIDLYAYRVEFEQIQVTQVTDAFPVTYSTYNVFASYANGLTLSFKRGTLQNSGLKAGVNLSIQLGAPSTSSNIEKITNGYVQYNFGERNHYKGPTTKSGKQPMRNIGIGLFFHLRDGNKYSRNRDVYPGGFITPLTYPPVLNGTINGSQIPSTSFLHLKIEKGVELTKINSRLNFYLMIQNVLNKQNVYNVYGFTGDPSDDGYLTDPGAQAGINSQNDPEAFKMLYELKVDDPGNYNAPRIIRLGAVFNF